MPKRVAIIGAGPSGLSQIRAFRSAARSGVEIPEIVCFEKQETTGGLWNYTWRTGLDEYGELVHNSMYRYLWSNGPKECLEFADYTFKEHFGRPIASYPTRAVLLDYIRGRHKKLRLQEDCIRFRTVVRGVSYSEQTSRFTVTVCDLVRQHTYSEEFDHLVVANGHFSTPNVPNFAGLDTFYGRVLHAHDFRDAREFFGKDILIIGTSYSAEDIGSQCYKYGCRSVTVSYRTRPMDFDWPDNWTQVPLLERVQDNTAYFKDGSSKKVDAIILCTGYQHHFPFLPDELKLVTENRLWPNGLYKGVVWENNPKLFYLGMQDQYFTFNMFDAQAWYVRDVILEKILLPSQEVMRKDSQGWRVREEALENPEQEIDFQGNYVAHLISATDYPNFDVVGVCQTFKEWEKHKKEGIMTFRDRCYRSLMTGEMSAQHHTLWLQAMDDSFNSYLEPTTTGSRVLNQSALFQPTEVTSDDDSAPDLGGAGPH